MYIRLGEAELISSRQIGRWIAVNDLISKQVSIVSSWLHIQHIVGLDYDSEYANLIVNHNYETVNLMWYEIRSITFNGIWPWGDLIFPFNR